MKALGLGQCPRWTHGNGGLFFQHFDALLEVTAMMIFLRDHLESVRMPSQDLFRDAF